MIILSHILNLVILIPVVLAMTLRPDSMDAAFGVNTDSRRILNCLYMTIALASVIALILFATGSTDVALNISLTLFCLQIAYKLLSVPMVGLNSPVVQTNLLVVAVHSVTLATLWFRTPD